MDSVIVVGGGLAGWRSAHELRTQGFTGRVVVVGDEPHPPYDRPPLSKEVLAGGPDPVLSPPMPDDVDWRPATRAVGLDAGARAVRLEGGSDLRYDGLVLACGARPRVPGGWTAVPGVRVLRTLDDASALREALAPGARVLLVGAGWIGAEVATAAVAAGAEVTAVDPLAAPLAASLPPGLAAVTASWWREAGATLRLGRSVTALRPAPDGVRATLDDGTSLVVDTVLVGIGVRPATDWLAGTTGVSLDAGGGIEVDQRLRAAPGVVAVGDCAARWSPRLGRRVTSEHWQEAMAGPAVAVATLLGGDVIDAAGPSFDPVPWLWSRQWGRMVTWAGWRVPGDRVVMRGGLDPAGSAALVHDAADGPRLTAVLAVDRPRDVSAARRLLADADARGVPVDEHLLADPEVPLVGALR